MYYALPLKSNSLLIMVSHTSCMSAVLPLPIHADAECAADRRNLRGKAGHEQRGGLLRMKLTAATGRAAGHRRQIYLPPAIRHLNVW